MSMHEIESMIYQELQKSPGMSRAYSDLLKSLARKIKSNHAELSEQLFALVKRLVYRGKISVSHQSRPVDLNYHKSNQFILTLKPVRL